jgi:hypothetical protein
MGANEFLMVSEAAEMIEKNRQTIYKRIKEKTIPVIFDRVGDTKNYGIPPDHFDLWIDRQMEIHRKEFEIYKRAKVKLAEWRKRQHGT